MKNKEILEVNETSTDEKLLRWISHLAWECEKGGRGWGWNSGAQKGGQVHIQRQRWWVNTSKTRRGMREMPVALTRANGDRSRRKAFGGNSRWWPYHPTSSLRPLFPSLFPSLAQLFAVGAESYKSSKADRTALYHVSSFLSPSLRSNSSELLSNIFQSYHL